ncbi:helix-turn-helix transcriptional regulator [Luteolibacter pohnpeiensis]|uniref:Helix-turn-helix transcriptional regulator n=1 Tax=Luteolibacter pohnpeiensis TaxID=454153 RepID=A0A934SD50_9BACT|nr:helix-turn-helix transcriptional regulator [Luteolibacter pohnpeiensis]MBK1883689.1 helix-turn-helix transcriptional regulator [Luteolibacter pohnpeiensis]
MKEKGLNASTLSLKIGKHRSYITKLLSSNGGISELSSDIVDQLSDVLGVSIQPIQTSEGRISPTAARLSALAEENEDVAALLETILRVSEPSEEAYLPSVETKKLPKIGAAVTRIVHEWEQGADPHYSKIAVETLHFLRHFYAKEM